MAAKPAALFSMLEALKDYRASTPGFGSCMQPKALRSARSSSAESAAAEIIPFLHINPQTPPLSQSHLQTVRTRPGNGNKQISLLLVSLGAHETAPSPVHRPDKLHPALTNLLSHQGGIRDHYETPENGDHETAIERPKCASAAARRSPGSLCSAAKTADLESPIP